MSDENMTKYAKTLLPCVYDDFVAEAKAVMTHEDRNRLRKLLNIRLKRHSRYTLPPDRLALIEKQIARRVQALLN